MNKKTKLIILGILGVVVVIILSFSITTAFMKPIESGGNLTEISLSSCAKIKLTGTSSINLSNTYPMSRNKGLQTTPYKFTVTSFCDTYVGFNLYIATLSTNTLDYSNIRYILTKKDSKEVIKEGTLSSSLSATSDFTSSEITELNTGLKGTYGSILKIHSEAVPYQGSKDFDLYLFVDGSVTSASGTFNAGVAVKAYERDPLTLANVCTNGTNLASCIKTYGDLGSQETSLYIHNSSLTNGAGYNSYRYAGGDYVLTSKATNAGLTTVITADNTSTNGVINFYCNGTKQYVGYVCSSSTHYYTLQYDSSNTQYETYSAALAKAVTDGYLTKDNVKNFVCFGSDATPCPTANLYRIIGVFGSQVKLIKWDYATSAMLGTNGDFSQQYSSFFSGEQGESPSSNALYYWNNVNYNAAYNATSKYNVWSYSQLNTINLNTNYITYLNNQNSKWANKIATTTWKVGGNTWANIGTSPMNTAYQNEIVNPSTDLSEQYRTYSAKIGLMYVSDYGYAASPTYWTYKGYDTVTTDYRAAKSNNWLYGGGWDWTISRSSDYSDFAFFVNYSGYVHNYNVDYDIGVRPVFYLTSSTSYVSGSGEASEPIRVN